MTNIEIQDKYIRFEPPAQQRGREMRLADWYVAVVVEDRAETARPPLELAEVGGNG